MSVQSSHSHARVTCRRVDRVFDPLYDKFDSTLARCADLEDLSTKIITNMKHNNMEVILTNISEYVKGNIMTQISETGHS